MTRSFTQIASINVILCGAKSEGVTVTMAVRFCAIYNAALHYKTTVLSTGMLDKNFDLLLLQNCRLIKANLIHKWCIIFMQFLFIVTKIETTVRYSSCLQRLKIEPSLMNNTVNNLA